MRIVAGQFRGRELRTPAGGVTRPTAARVREALFAILADVQSAHVLDLYAGSGALGLEALSRGAERLVLVESSRAAQQAIRSNLTALGVESRATLLPLRAEASCKALERCGAFSLVFADPPWADTQAALAVLEKLAAASLFAPAARLVFEHAARMPPRLLPGSRLRATDTRRWGDTGMTLFELEQTAGPPLGNGDDAATRALQESSEASDGTARNRSP